MTHPVAGVEPILAGACKSRAYSDEASAPAVPIRVQFQADGPLQLLLSHPNAVVNSHVTTAMHRWDQLQAQDRALLDDTHMGMPITTVVDRLRNTCASLHNDNATLARLTGVLIPLLTVSRAMDLAVVSNFSRLGSGSFGTIFVSEGRGGVVIKQVQDPANAAVLDKEHRDLKQLYEVVSVGGNPPFFSLPRPHGFYEDYWTFAREADLPRTFDIGLPPHAMYVMQRIWPVPTSLTERIRDQFFPAHAKHLPFRPFLARLYLGLPQLRPNNPFFKSDNFLLDAARIEQLQLPADSIAAGMGQMLARINFRAGRDGRDIEFVLCGDPLNPLSRHPTYSCIDFNQMRPHHDDAAAIVDSMANNDPYYPRPDSPYWSPFADAYAAEAVDAGQPQLALQVLSLWRGKYARLGAAAR